MIQLVFIKGETKVGLATRDLHGLHNGVKEGTGTNIESSDGDIVVFSRDRSTELGTLEVNDIGWDGIRGQIVHTFVKTSVLCNFDTSSFWVEPKYIVSCLGNKAEEDTLARVRTEFGIASTRRTNPNSTTKCAETGEIIGGVGCNLQRSMDLITRRK